MSLSRSVAGVLALWMLAPAGVAAQGEAVRVGWLVDAATALSWIERGATVIDVRSPEAFARGHLRGAVRASWFDFSPRGAKSEQGTLRPAAELQQALRTLGVFQDRPVVVVGDPREWGEDGRVVWMLRSLGHPGAAMVSGGYRALVQAGAPIVTAASAPAPGDVTARPTDRFTADRAAVRAALGDGATVLLDTRTRAEFDGATPHGAARGGHLPGARHLDFQDLMDEDGRLRPEAELRSRLAAAGVKPGVKVIAYCTGGVRSAWLVGVLEHLGIAGARNYPGSTWEWAAGDAAEYPLEKTAPVTEKPAAPEARPAETAPPR